VSDAASRALSRVFELVLLAAVVAIAAYAAFTWAVGPEVRTVLLWLLGLLRRGVGLASAAYRWVLEQLRELG
jgi:hypothetical protein